MKKEIVIKDIDREVTLQLSSDARIFRLYRAYFKKDLLTDFIKLKKYQDAKTKEIDEEGLAENFDFEIIENMFYICTYACDSSIGSIDNFLSQFQDPFALINRGQDVFELLGMSMASQKKAKKSQRAVTMKK